MRTPHLLAAYWRDVTVLWHICNILRTDLTHGLVLGVFGFSSCSAGNSNGSTADAGAVVKLQGRAGASFPAPLYTKWFKTYSDSHPNVQIDYQSVGSGSGVKSVIDKTVDFGASDAAMTPEDMQKVNVGIWLLPMTAGAIVLTTISRTYLD